MIDVIMDIKKDTYCNGIIIVFVNKLTETFSQTELLHKQKKIKNLFINN